MSIQKVLITASRSIHIRLFHTPYLKWLHEKGYEVHVLTGDITDNLPYADVLHYIPLEKHILSMRNMRSIAAVKRLLCEEQFSLIITNTQLSSFYVRMAVKSLPEKQNICPVVTIVHGYLLDDKESFIKRNMLLFAEKMTAPVTDVLCVMNEEDAKIASKYHLYKTKLIQIPGMGLDESRFLKTGEPDRQTLRTRLGIGEQEFVLLYAAEFSKRKNHSMLMKVMKRLPKDISLILLGEGIKSDKMKRMAQKYGISGRTHFIGQVPDTRNYLCSADAVVSTSRYEGCPFHLMEALTVGLPIIVSDVKGNRDLVQNGVNGLSFPYGSVDDMVKAILQVRNQKEKLHVVLDKEYTLEEAFGKITGAIEPYL